VRDWLGTAGKPHLGEFLQACLPVTISI